MSTFINVVNKKLPGQVGRIPKAALPQYEAKGWEPHKDPQESRSGTSSIQAEARRKLAAKRAAAESSSTKKEA